VHADLNTGSKKLKKEQVKKSLPTKDVDCDWLLIGKQTGSEEVSANTKKETSKS